MKLRCTLYLVRHGEVEPRDTFYGQLDVPLSARGTEQARAVAAVLATLPLGAVHCSDLSRALEGATLIAAPHGLAPQPSPAFREMSLGVLEGLARDEGLRRMPDVASRRYRDMWSYRFPEGENLADVEVRVWPALQPLLDGAGPDRPLVLVAHNSVNRVILGRVLGLTVDKVFDFDQDFGCLNRVDFHEGGARVKLLNWTPGWNATGTAPTAAESRA
jgi:alpha-ribazole phosphatase